MTWSFFPVVSELESGDANRIAYQRYAPSLRSNNHRSLSSIKRVAVHAHPPDNTTAVKLTHNTRLLITLLGPPVVRIGLSFGVVRVLQAGFVP